MVVNSASSVEAGDAVAESLPGESATSVPTSACRTKRTRLIDATIERYGQLDYLVNNAGWTTVVPHDNLDDLTDEIFRKTFDVNVFGTWWLTKRAIPHLRESDDPCIVNITSIAGVRPVGSSMAYSMTKAALNHMTVLLAKSYGPIRVNAVAPGTRGARRGPPTGTRCTPASRRWRPIPRSATPEDCAEAVLALLRNKYTSGEIFVVDGGLTQVM